MKVLKIIEKVISTTVTVACLAFDAFVVGFAYGVYVTDPKFKRDVNRRWTRVDNTNYKNEPENKIGF